MQHYTVAIEDCDLSIDQLAKRANLSRNLITACVELGKYGDPDPLPTICPGNQHKVRWSIWCEWSMRRLGPEGDLRGVFRKYFEDLKTS